MAIAENQRTVDANAITSDADDGVNASGQRLVEASVSLDQDRGEAQASEFPAEEDERGAREEEATYLVGSARGKVQSLREAEERVVVAVQNLKEERERAEEERG
eukprot:3773411-Rhodomonas_salina.1